MRILVTFAVRAEFTQWSSRHPFVPYEFENWEKRREFELFQANIGSNVVSVLLTGIGPQNAEMAMSTVPIEAYDACISTGLAGSLDARFRPGDIVVARISETLDGALQVKGDAALAGIAINSGAHAVDVFLTSGKIVATAEEKQELSGKGSVVEMETAHVLLAAGKHRVPAVAVRVISDAADEDLPVDFERILDSHGHLRLGGLFKEVGLHPYRLGPLLRFGRQSRKAAASLSSFLDRYIPSISQRWIKVPCRDIEEVSAT
jgi:adenosylhomocysteine nucleosidase